MIKMHGQQHIKIFIRVLCFGTQKLVVLSVESKYITLTPTTINLRFKFDVEGQISVSKNYPCGRTFV